MMPKMSIRLCGGILARIGSRLTCLALGLLVRFFELGFFEVRRAMGFS